MRGGDGAPTIMAATTGVADDELFGFRIVAPVSFSNAARMQRRGDDCRRQRAKVGREHDEQQESGNQSMHVGV
jgi:hypothetical protein